MPRPLLRACAALLAVLALAGCGDGAIRGTAGSRVKQLNELAPPSDLLGLTTQAEDVTKLVATESDLYIDAVGIYSLRRDDVVQATLQISRFNGKARPDDEEFRRSLITQLGGSEGTPTTVGKDTVYISQAKTQRVAVWFREDAFVVLTTRDDYDMPRALLREALQIGDPA